MPWRVVSRPASDSSAAAPLADRTGPRRWLLRSALFTGLGLSAAGSLLALGRFFTGATDLQNTRRLRVVPGDVPRPGDPPRYVAAGKLYLVNLRRGEGGHGALAGSTRAGMVALYQGCTHLRCRVPWRPDFQFEGKQGWFRCPCHGVTYTKAGVRVFGPAPRDMDFFDLTRDHDGGVTVHVDVIHTGQCRDGGCL
ncbi:MAG: QcrA and Rieske domain-containing protein [Dehalococcoidia bacterium]